MTGYRYRAFISYSHSDAPTARWLHRALEGYRPPPEVVARLDASRRRITPVFLDRDETRATGSISGALTAALNASEFLIVVCSPAAARSRWVNEEVAHFKRSGRANNVLCVLAGGDAADPTHTFPRACLFEFDAAGELDTSAPVEPLAADLRRTGDGRNRAMLKLASTMLDVRFDDLVRREAARRQRRLAGVALASTVGMVLATGLAIFALEQRNEALHQRAIAEEESHTLANTVEFLVNIFKVSDPATENPRNITALQILDRGARRLEVEQVGRPHIRGRLMSTIGDVYLNLGQFSASRDELERSLKLLQPDSMPALEARIVLASALARLGEFDLATAQFRRADATLTERYPTAHALRGKAQRFWGNMEFARGSAAQALPHLRSALAFYLRDGTDPLGLARTRFELAGALMDKDASSFAEAGQLLALAIASLEQSVGAANADTVIAKYSLGRLRLREGRLREAVVMLRQTEVDLSRIFGANHPNVTLAQIELGNALLQQDQASSAVTVLRRAVRNTSALTGKGRAQYAEAALSLASALSRQGGSAQEARTLVAAADAVIREEFGGATPELGVLRAQADVAAAYGGAAERQSVCAAAISAVAKDAGMAALWRPEFARSCPKF